MSSDQSVQEETSSPVVNIGENTSLRGKISKSSASERSVYTFLGVPYATPPIGELRFKAPKPLVLWDGEKDATNYASACPQDDAAMPVFEKFCGFPLGTPDSKSEDCLYLDVFTPSLKSTDKLPVMVYIHGGGYMVGSSKWHNPIGMSFLEDVVIVSINYRLGPIGFLCTGDDIMPGNYGLQDQIEALRWVQSYIGNFGGDKDNVTVFGESAGSMSTSLLILIKEAQGLFHKAISQSGTSFSCDCIITKEKARNFLLTKVKEMGCEATSSTDILSFLQSKTPEELNSNFKRGQQPVIDGRLVEDDIETLHKAGSFSPIPYMLGVCSDEGAIIVLLKCLFSESTIDTFEKARKFLSELNFFKDIANEYDVNGLIDALIAEYITEEGNEAPVKGVSEILLDYMYVVPTLQTIFYHQEKAPTYLFMFDHRPSYTPSPPWVKADHTADIPFVFGMPFEDLPNMTFTEDEKRLSKDIVQKFVNFARTGCPTPKDASLEWPEHNISRQYIRLNTNPSIEVNLRPNKYHFWCDAMKKYRK